MNARLLTFVLSMAASTTSAIAGGLGDQMERMFDGMSAYTRPGYYESQSRGVITGGGFSYRTRQADMETLFAISPPTISAGCSGIDVYLGSFSAISMDEITDMAKAIAGQAAGYAFEVALKSVCPTCASTMENLRAFANEINTGMRGSCELARSLVDRTTTNGMWEFMKWDALDSASARADAWIDNYRDALEARRRQVDFVEDMPDEIKNVNPLYRAMKQQNMAAWFGGANDDEFVMDMLSLFGMVTFCAPSQGNINCMAYGDTESLREIDLPPTLKLVHLVYGADSPLSPAMRAEVYRCSDPNCLNPYKTDYRDPGLAQRIKDAFLGTDTSPGILSKIQGHVTEAMTPEEAGIFSASADMATIATNLARTSSARAQGFIDTWAGLMATDLAYDLALEVYHGLVAAVRMTPGTGNEIALERLQRRMDELTEERKRLSEQVTNASVAMIEHYDLMRRTLVENSRLYGAAPGPNVGAIEPSRGQQ